MRTAAELVLHPAEAARRGLADRWRRGCARPTASATLPVRLDAACPEGVAYVAADVPASGVGRLLPPDRGPVRVEVGHAA